MRSFLDDFMDVVVALGGISTLALIIGLPIYLLW